MQLRAVVITSSLVVATASVVARADEIPCDFFIGSVPFTISAPGHYCLSSNVAYTGFLSAITIDANSVVLDLRGYKINNLGAGPGTIAYGIFVNNHRYVVVRNGLVRGFDTGILFFGNVNNTNNSNNIVEHVTVDSSTFAGINFGLGTNNTVRDSTVSSTGGTTVQSINTIGIQNGGTSGFVENCTVTNTFPAAAGTIRIGIFMYDGRALNNQVIGDGGTGDNFCLWMGTGIYKDNVVSGCTTAYEGYATAVPGTNYP